MRSSGWRVKQRARANRRVTNRANSQCNSVGGMPLTTALTAIGGRCVRGVRPRGCGHTANNIPHSVGHAALPTIVLTVCSLTVHSMAHRPPLGGHSVQQVDGATACKQHITDSATLYVPSHRLLYVVDRAQADLRRPLRVQRCTQSDMNTKQHAGGRGLLKPRHAPLHRPQYSADDPCPWCTGRKLGCHL